MIILHTHFGEIIFYNICKNLFPNFINKQKKEVCICTLGKEENKYIKDFVEHYKGLGVDKIFIYDNNAKNGEKFDDVLSEYINILKIYNHSFFLYNFCKKIFINYYSSIVIINIKKNMIGLFSLTLMSLSI